MTSAARPPSGGPGVERGAHAEDRGHRSNVWMRYLLREGDGAVHGRGCLASELARAHARCTRTTFDRARYLLALWGDGRRRPTGAAADANPGESGEAVRSFSNGEEVMSSRVHR